MAERREVYAKCNGHCAYCGREITFREMQVDHVTSLHNHGADDVSNMLPACRECNHYKKACSLEGFRRRMRKAMAREKNVPSVALICERFGDWGDRFWFEREV